MNAQQSLFHDQTPTVDEVMAVWAHDRAFRSRAQIAEALGRSKSPTLIAILGVLLGIGYLTMIDEKLPNGAHYYKYAPTVKWEQDGRFLF